MAESRRKFGRKPSTQAGRRSGSQPPRTSPDATATRNAQSDGLYKADPARMLTPMAITERDFAACARPGAPWIYGRFYRAV
jgi:hypothetical protein